MNHLSRAGAFLLALFMTTTLAQAPQAASAAAPTLAAGVGQELVYNDPRIKDATNPTHPNRDAVIVERMESGIAGVPAGGKARGITWRFDRGQAYDVSLAAVKRGVDYRIAIQGHSWGEKSGFMTDKLDADLNAIKPGSVVKCGGSSGCLGTRDGATEHAKVWTFSETEGRRYVVMFTASNVSNGQVGTYNDLLIVWGDKVLYDKVNVYIEDTLAKRRDGAYRQNKGTFSSVASLIDVKAGPSNASTKPDDYVSLLRKYDGAPGCDVFVPTSHFRDVRVKVADELVSMKRQGAQVVVLSRVQSPDGTALGAVEAKLKAAGIPFRVGSPHQHIKGLIVKDCYAAGTTIAANDVSVHGSEHLAGDVWRNNEIMVVNRHQPAIDRAERWFRQNAARAGLSLAP